MTAEEGDEEAGLKRQQVGQRAVSESERQQLNQEAAGIKKEDEEAGLERQQVG